MAVYTEVSSESLDAFLSDYNIGKAVSFKGIAEGVENSNFLLKTDMGDYILTLYEKRVDENDLPFFLGLMDHLAARGISCPTPIRRKDGETLSELCERPAAIISFLQGVWPRDIEPYHCAELGAAMAHFHKGGEGFEIRRENALGMPAWRPLFEKCKARADEVAPGLAAALEVEIEFLEAHWPQADSLPTGVIHADMFQDNVFFLGSDLSGIIDFYFACNDFLVYDLAICLDAWCFDQKKTFNIDKAKAMIERYQMVRPLSQAELEALPILARGASVRFLLTRLFDWLNHPPGAFVQPKDPMEYYGYLQFHQTVTSPKSYGV